MTPAPPVLPVKQGSFASDVLKLVSGTTSAQVLSVLVAPILSRLYSPDAFGTLAVFTSITATVTVVSCLRYELAIMLPESDEEAANLLAVSVFFVFLISGLTAVIVALGQRSLVSLLKAPQVAPYLWLVPPTVFVSGVFLALNYWNSRTKHFGRLSIAQLSRSIVTNASQIGMATVGHAHGGGLIWSTVLGSTTVTAVLGGQVWRDDSRLLRSSLNGRRALGSLRRYYKFPVFGVWSALLNTLSWQLPVMMLSAFFSPATVGSYALGNRVVRMPVILVGGAIAQVFFQRSSVAKTEGQLSKTVENVFEHLVSLGFFPMLALSLMAEQLFVVVFGPEWAEAGIYTAILSLYMFFNFISSPLGQLFSVLEKQEAGLITNVALLLSRFGALLIGGRTGDIQFTLYLFSASGVLVYGGFSFWLLTSAGVPARRYLRTLFRWSFLSGMILAIAWLFCSWLKLESWSLLAVYGIAALVYYGYVFMSDAELCKHVLHTDRSRWRRK